MQFKIDENLHPEVAELLRQHGHDATTVYDQGLRGHSDAEIAQVCRREARALVTMDLDFADIRAYPPQGYTGIMVLRLTDQSRPAVLRVFRQMLALLNREPLAEHLWIVEEHQIRMRSPRGGGQL
jgi:predicted nuclease of predicted toxin-antitoxin system